MKFKKIILFSFITLTSITTAHASDQVHCPRANTFVPGVNGDSFYVSGDGLFQLWKVWTGKSVKKFTFKRVEFENSVASPRYSFSGCLYDADGELVVADPWEWHVGAFLELPKKTENFTFNGNKAFCDKSELTCTFILAMGDDDDLRKRK